MDFIQRTIDLAKQNVEQGGRPFACIIVKEDEIIAEAVNLVAQTRPRKTFGHRTRRAPSRWRRSRPTRRKPTQHCGQARPIARSAPRTDVAWIRQVSWATCRGFRTSAGYYARWPLRSLSRLLIGGRVADEDGIAWFDIPTHLCFHRITAKFPCPADRHSACAVASVHSRTSALQSN